MKSLYIFYIVVVSCGITLLLWGCKAPEYGCKKRQQKKCRKHFAKAVNLCQTEAMAQSLLFFPFSEKDSSWSNTETVRDTFTHYDTLLVNDTVYITRYQDRVVNKTNTLYKETKVTDSREVNLLKEDIKALSVQLVKARQAEYNAKQAHAKDKGKLVVVYWISGILAAIIGLSIGIKIFKFKIPFLG